MKRLFLAVVLCATAAACTRVAPGYVGIEVNLSGGNRGVQDYPLKTGRVWYNPINADVLEWPTFVQNAAWTHNVAEGHPVNEEVTFTTADQMSVAADISIGYSLIAEKVPAFYVKFRTADMDAFTHGFLRNMAREKFDSVAGQYRIEQIMGDNAPFVAKVRASLQAELDGVGVKLEQFGFIGAPRPPATVIEAINAKVQATQKAIQIENEVRQSTAEGAKQIALAEAQAKSTLVYAEAQAAANRKISDSLSTNLIELKRLEKWNGTLPTTVTSGSVPFVNVR